MTLTEKVAELAEEVKEDIALVRISRKEMPNRLITGGRTLAACREYSGILRGLCEMFKSLGIEYYAEGIVVELIDIWKRVLGK